MADLQITFDDGPEPESAALEPLLYDLEELGVVAGFFVIGQEVHRSLEAAVMICGHGHVLGNQSWDHLSPRTSRYTDAEIVEQFRRTHEEVRRATGMSMRHWRAPRLEAISRLEMLLFRGKDPLYALSHCDIHADSEDGLGTTTASGMIEAIEGDFAWQPRRSSFRLLFHVKKATAKVFRQVLEGLVAEGHVLVDFSQGR
jgi:peptidoglycan/xylan/chitin deacetylase (PgdA/CDA1 family)